MLSVTAKAMLCTFSWILIVSVAANRSHQLLKKLTPVVTKLCSVTSAPNVRLKGQFFTAAVDVSVSFAIIVGGLVDSALVIDHLVNKIYFQVAADLRLAA